METRFKLTYHFVMTQTHGGPKHANVFATLRREIQAGHWKPGARLPSEAELVERFGVSRITIGRAVRDLQQAGLVERRAGSGTFIRTGGRRPALSFGLLIPDLGETEIFEPICQGMMASPIAHEHALVWGSAQSHGGAKGESAWQLCRQYIDRRVSGAFFAPLELVADKDEWNRRIGRAFDEARIPLVLLDRALHPYPDPGHHDLVGIDNRRAGYVMTAHLLQRGCRRVAFVGPAHAASTVDAREAGYREALYAHGLSFDPALAVRLAPADEALVKAFLKASRADGILAANDHTAGILMRTLLALGHRIPQDIRLAGIDDVDYARLLPVPLTTLRQPTRAIGDMALMVMLDRVARRDLPARRVELYGELVVRESCGPR